MKTLTLFLRNKKKDLPEYQDLLKFIARKLDTFVNNNFVFKFVIYSKRNKKKLKAKKIIEYPTLFIGDNKYEGFDTIDRKLRLIIKNLQSKNQRQVQAAPQRKRESSQELLENYWESIQATGDNETVDDSRNKNITQRARAFDQQRAELISDKTPPPRRESLPKQQPSQNNQSNKLSTVNPYTEEEQKSLSPDSKLMLQMMENNMSDSD